MVQAPRKPAKSVEPTDDGDGFITFGAETRL
jgi:hypothetical protein